MPSLYGEISASALESSSAHSQSPTADAGSESPAAEAQGVAHLLADSQPPSDTADTDDPDASEPASSPSRSTSSGADRPNRFLGPPQSWRHYTAPDRQLAASMDQLDAGELNVHLYNTHALKQRLRSSARSHPAELKNWQSKDRWLKQGEELDILGPDGAEERELVPWKRWSAWPLEPSEVPREGERFGRVAGDEEDEKWTVGNVGAERVSQELGDVVMGVFLRLAKERWVEREWEDADTETDAEEGRQGSVQTERETRSRSHSGKRLATADSSSDVADISSRRRSQRSRSRSTGTTRSDDQDVEMEDQVVQSTESASRMSTRASSRATDACEQSDDSVSQSERSDSQPQSRATSEAPHEQPQQTNLRTLRKSEPRFSKPTVLADDDKARNILQPSINSLLVKLDFLLDGLHRSRVNHFAEASSASASEAQTDVEAAVPPRKKARSRVTSKSRISPPSAARRRQKHQTDDIVDVGVSFRDDNRPTNSETQKRPIRPTLADSASGSDYAPDDDKLGSQSAPTDCDMRASKSRYSKKSLLTSQPDPKSRRSNSISSITSETEPDARVGLRDWSEVIGMASLMGWSDGVVERAAKRCAALFGEGMAFRTFHEGSALKSPEEPVIYIPETILAPDSTVLDGSNIPHIPDTETRPHWESGSLICPHIDCWGHEKEFRIPYRVVEHLIRVHGYDPRIPGSDGEDEMVGGVHADGFLQPISAKQGWRGGDKAAVSDKRKKRKRESG